VELDILLDHFCSSITYICYCNYHNILHILIENLQLREDYNTWLNEELPLTSGIAYSKLNAKLYGAAVPHPSDMQNSKHTEN
jgi:hypothetical protein